MSGSWHLYRRGQRWAKPRSRLGRDPRRGARGGPVGRADPACPSLRAAAARPEAGASSAPTSSADFDPAEAIARIRRQDPARELGDALLDQRLLAGIGNVFKSEACFADEARPRARLAEVSDGDLDAVIGRPGSRCWRGAQRAPPAGGLRAPRRALPPLRRPDPLARAGRLEPDHLLVPALPGPLSASAARLGDNRRMAVSEESAVELLRKVPLFSQLEQDELVRFSRVAVPRSFPPGPASFTRAITPTPATSSARGTSGSPASIRTGEPSRSPTSAGATSSASWRCWTARCARPASRRSATASCSPCRLPTCERSSPATRGSP